MKRIGLGLAAAAVAGLAMAEFPQGLVLRFSCDEFRSNGTALPDATGSNAVGRVSNVRLLGTGGRLNGGCEFTGKNSYVAVPGSALLDNKRVSLALWLKGPKPEWHDRTLVDNRAETGYALKLVGGGKENSNKGKLLVTVCGHSCLSDEPVADNAWHHAAFTYDGETVKLYVDGVLQKQTAAWRGEINAPGQELTFGMNRSNPSAKEKDVSFEGTLDEICLFKRALTEAEVKDVIAMTKPKFTKQQVERRLKELKDLLDRGLILQDFYDRKVKECEY